MDTSGYYKLDPGGSLLYGKWVIGPYNSFSLNVDNKDTNTYPIDGWYWFDTREDAVAYLNYTE